MESTESTTILYERVRREFHKDGDNFDNMDAFLKDLDGMITRNKGETNLHSAVFGTVKEMVKKILDVVGVIDPAMKAGKVHPVGSFREGTKLGTPNEFDFVVELIHFEKMKTLLVKNECKIDGAVHLLISDEKETIETETSVAQTTETQPDIAHLVMETTHAQVCKYLSPVRFRNRFWQLITAVATQLAQQNFTIESDAGKLEIAKDTAQPLDMYDKGPNIEVFMVWTSADEIQKFGLSVDITPALRLLEDLPLSDGIDNVRVKRYIEICGSQSANILLIPTINLECKHGSLLEVDEKLCWKLSFSLLETEIIHNMKPDHKVCLRVLKHLKSKQNDSIEELNDLGLDLSDKDPFSAIIIRLQHSGGEMSLLTTYRMKMAVLQHDESCDDKSHSPGKCLMEILDILQQCVRQKFLPVYFVPKKNAWSRGPLVLLETSFEKIISFFHYVLKIEDYSFDKILEKFITVQNYITESDGV